MTAAAPSLRKWGLVAALALAPAVSNGFARFAYGLILPAMRTDLGWTYTEAGWINTANALGYLIGALIALTLIARIGTRTMFVGGMLMTALALLFSGLTENFWLLTVWRILAGVGGAPAFIAGGAMAAAVFRNAPMQSALALALYFGGGGLGMLASGATVPLVLDGAPAAWPSVWVGMGIASLVTMLPVAWAAREVKPADKGGGVDTSQPLPWRAMLPELSAYFLFAVGYIVYITFIVAWMRETDASAGLVAVMWSLMGIAVMVSPFAWRSVHVRYSGGAPLALSNAATGIGTLLPLVVAGPAGVIVSALVFGSSFFMSPGAVAAFGRANLPEPQWGASIALFTSVFGVGQLVGPVAAGYIADATDGVGTGLAAAGIILLAGGALALLQKPLVRAGAA